MKDLNSKDDKKVVAELDRAEQKGDINWVLPLLQAFRDRKEDEIRERMGDMLATVKLSGAEQIYIEALESGDCENIEADILGFIWSAGFDPANKLDLITRIATKGDFRAALEALTIIEQCEIIEEEHVLLEAILNIRSAIDTCEDESWKAIYEPMLAALIKLERAQ
ncbi:MAG: hypothetical protein CL847_06095 [Crocinitomicaceae bacterium]|nr:hypothetical protein [Crocinitomicaceae bacterium]|tara:strand:+ start:19813 stop:20310 length:498 start_codon:yes stop_codon:yes gene_type:complete